MVGVHGEVQGGTRSVPRFIYCAARRSGGDGISKATPWNKQEDTPLFNHLRQMVK